MDGNRGQLRSADFSPQERGNFESVKDVQKFLEPREFLRAQARAPGIAAVPLSETTLKPTTCGEKNRVRAKESFNG